jgi:hypothetical protein
MTNSYQIGIYSIIIPLVYSMSSKPDTNLSEEDIAAAIKVLSAVSYNRDLLTQEKFKSVLEKGKELFTPRRFKKKFIKK